MRRFESREARFSARTLLTYASASLPETLAVVAAVDDAPAEILLYDEIGFWGTNASDFAQALSQAGDGPIVLRINSPGGDVFDGYAIYNMLRARSAPVSVVIDGLAASAASFIAMAGKTITMGEPSMLMIHNSWGLCIGDRNDMLDMAATQEKIDGQIAAIYAGKCGKPVADMAAAMDSETWYTSTEAKATGLCDVLLSAPEAADASNKTKAAVKVQPRSGVAAAKVRAAYDPDGDGDDDAAEAIGLIQSALGNLTDAIECLNGMEREGDVTDASRRPPKAAVTPAERVAETENLPNAGDTDPDGQAQQRARLNRLRLAEADAA